MMNVLIPLTQGCEELEAVTIIDLLRRAQFEVTTAGLEPHQSQSRHHPATRHQPRPGPQNKL